MRRSTCGARTRRSAPSPRGEEHDIGDSNPSSIFGYVASELGHRSITFLFVREIEGDDSQLTLIKEKFGGPLIANEEMRLADAERIIDSGSADAVAFGRDYIATPDLAERIASDHEWNTPNPATFYSDGATDPAISYTDYPSVVHG